MTLWVLMETEESRKVSGDAFKIEINLDVSSILRLARLQIESVQVQLCFVNGDSVCDSLV